MSSEPSASGSPGTTVSGGSTPPEKGSGCEIGKCEASSEESAIMEEDEEELTTIALELINDIEVCQKILHDKEIAVAPLRANANAQEAAISDLRKEVESLSEEDELHYIYRVYDEFFRQLERDVANGLIQDCLKADDWARIREFRRRRNEFFHHPIDITDAKEDRRKLKLYAHRLSREEKKLITKVMKRLKPTRREGRKGESRRSRRSVGERSSSDQSVQRMKRVRVAEKKKITILADHVGALRDEAKNLHQQIASIDKEWPALAAVSASLSATHVALQNQVSELRERSERRTVYRIVGEFLFRMQTLAAHDRNLNFTRMATRLSDERELNPDSYWSSDEHQRLHDYLQAMDISDREWDLSVSFVQRRDDDCHCSIVDTDWDDEQKTLDRYAHRLQANEEALIMQAMALLRKVH